VAKDTYHEPEAAYYKVKAALGEDHVDKLDNATGIEADEHKTGYGFESDVLGDERQALSTNGGVGGRRTSNALGRNDIAAAGGEGDGE